MSWDFNKNRRNTQGYLAGAVFLVLSFAFFPRSVFGVPVLKVSAPGIPEAKDIPSANLLSVVAGQVSGQRIWINDGWVDLPQVKMDSATTNSTQSSTKDLNAGTSNSGLKMVNGTVPARFSLGIGTDGRCSDNKRIRDLMFLIRSMSKGISAVEVFHEEPGTPCAQSLVNQLTSGGISAQMAGSGAQPEKNKVILRVYFADTGKDTELAKGDKGEPPASAVTPGPDDSTAPANATPGSQSTPPSYSVFIDGKLAPQSPDGWFVALTGQNRAVDIEVRVGRDSILRTKAEILLLKPGFNVGYKTDRYVGVDLQNGASLQAELLDRPEKELAGLDSSISVPVFLKLGLGFTSLTPLPSEKERDRPTIVIAARSYPFWERYHVSAEIMTSLKSSSRVPWTVLGTFLGGTDLIQFRGNWSVPVGAGFRLFQSSIKKQTAAAANGKPIRIPEAVLGPALQAGASYRRGLFYAELAGSITPVFAAGANPIVTFNPLFASGYQISPIDIVTLNMMIQDIRYPSLLGEAKVVSSSIFIGYQRDFL